MNCGTRGTEAQVMTVVTSAILAKKSISEGDKGLSREGH